MTIKQLQQQLNSKLAYEHSLNLQIQAESTRHSNKVSELIISTRNNQAEITRLQMTILKRELFNH